MLPTPLTKEPEDTSKTIIVYGFSDPDEQKIPPPPDLTNTGPVGECTTSTTGPS